MASPIFVPKLKVKIEAHDNLGPLDCIKPNLFTVKQENLTGLFLSTDLQTPIYSLVPTIKVEPESESILEEVIESEFMDGESRCEGVPLETDIIKTDKDFTDTTISCESGLTLSVSREYIVPPFSDVQVPDFLASNNVSNDMIERKSVAPAEAYQPYDNKFSGSRPVSAPRLKKSTNEEVKYGSFQRERILSKSSALSRNNILPSLESLIEDTIISALSGDGSTAEVINGSYNDPVLPVRDSHSHISSLLGSGQQDSVRNTGSEMSLPRRHSSSFFKPNSKKQRVASSNTTSRIAKPVTKPVKATISVSALLKKTLQARQTSKPIRTTFDTLNHSVEKQLIEKSSTRLQAEGQDDPTTLNSTEAKQHFKQQITEKSFKPTPESSSILNIINEYYPIGSPFSSNVTENHLKRSGQVPGPMECNIPTTTCSVDSLILSTIIGSLNCDKAISSNVISGRTAFEVHKTNFPNIADPVAMKYHSPRVAKDLQFIDKMPELVRDSVIVLKPTSVDHSMANSKPKLELTEKAFLFPKETLKVAKNSLPKPTPILESIPNPNSCFNTCHGGTNEVMCTDSSLSILSSHKFLNTTDLILTGNTKISNSDPNFAEGMSNFRRESSQVTTKRTSEQKAVFPKGSGILCAQNPTLHSTNGYEDTDEVTSTNSSISVLSSHKFPNIRDLLISTHNAKISTLNPCFAEGVPEVRRRSSQVTTNQTSKPKADYPKTLGILNPRHHSVNSNPSLCTQQILQSAKNFVPACTLGDTAECVIQAKIDSKGSEQIPGTITEIESIDISEDSSEPYGGDPSSTSGGVPKPITLSRKVLPEKSESSVEENHCRREKIKLSTGGNVEAGNEEHAQSEILSVLNKFSEGSLSEKEKAEVTVMPVELFSSPQSIKQASLSDEFHFIQNKGWACNKCGKLYISKRGLWTHKIYKHYLLDKFICPQCQAVFPSQVSCRKHHKMCRKPVYKCPECPKFYPSILLYERHYMYHHESAYICLDCSPPKDFRGKSRLIDHMSLNHLHICIPCKACGKVLKTNHVAKHLQIHDRKKLQCFHCKKHFTALATLRAHWKTHSSSGTAAYMCKFCGKFFELKPDFVRHLKEHKNERSFVCEYCGKAFFRGDHLTYHLRIHCEKNFICANCDQGFFYKHQLTEHLGIRACSINGMSFSKKVKRAKKMKKKVKRSTSKFVCEEDSSTSSTTL